MIAAYATTYPEDPMRVDVVIQRGSAPPHGAWFYLYVADCFDPVRYLVSGDNMDDAVEWLLDDPSFVRSQSLDACDMADYGPEDLTWNDRGDAFDLEALAGFPCSVRVVRGDYWSDVIGPACNVRGEDYPRHHRVDFR